MDLSYKKYFDLGIVISAVFPEIGDGSGPIVDHLDYVLDTGLFDLVETTSRKDEQGFLDLKTYLARKNVRTVYLAAGAIFQKKLDLNSLDEAQRQKAVAVLKECVARAYFLNAEKLLICSGPDPGPAGREKAKRQLIRSLKEILEEAKRLQENTLLEIVFEHFDRELHKKRLMGPTRETVDLIQELKKDYAHINIALDQSHIRQLGEDPKESLFLTRDCLAHVHLANCILKDRAHPQWGDEHPPFNLEEGEMGTEDIARLFATLFEMGYLKQEPQGKRPTLSLEVKPLTPEGDRIATFKGTCDTFLEAWRLYQSRV